MGKFHSKKKHQGNRKKAGKKRSIIENISGNAKSKDPGCPKFTQKSKIERKGRGKNRSKSMKSQNTKKKTLPGMVFQAEKRANEFLSTEEVIDQINGKSNLNQNFKKCYKEFKKVIEAADVIVEVLDARDPLGSRCKEVEQAVIDAGPDKRLILLINKVDLIPRDNLESWLKYLRREFPTVAFKASTQSQKANLSQSKVAAIHMSEKLQTTSRCIGAKFLMKILGNYCRSKNIMMSIKVGVVGFPNVGKSSVINSLKRCHACDVGSTPGITKTMQEIVLDKHVRLLDCPGVVFAKDGPEYSLALRNAIKIETLDDVITPAKAIVERVDHAQLCDHYKVPKFSSVEELLFLLAKRIGRFKKGGIPDADAAALKLINDWNNGIIKYYTHPPEVHEPLVQISAEVVQEMGKAFDISALADQMEIDEMLEEDDEPEDESKSQPDPSDTMEVASENPKNQVGMEGEKPKTSDKKSCKTSPSISTKFNVKKKKDANKNEPDVDVLKFQKNRQNKNLFKKMKKKRRRSEKLSAALSKTLDAALSTLS